LEDGIFMGGALVQVLKERIWFVQSLIITIALCFSNITVRQRLLTLF